MRTTLALALTAALLAAYIVFVERHRPTTDEQRASRTRLLPRFDRHQVSRLTITRRGAAPFSLERAARAGRDLGPGWQVSPGRTADETAVEELLTELDFAEIDRDADLGAAEAGLAPPAVTIEIDGGGGPTGLRLGRADATGRGVFAIVDGGAGIKVAPRRLLDLADRQPDAFRDRRQVVIKTAGGGDLTLTWTAPDRSSRTLARVSGRWRNEGREWVEGERVDEALRRFADLRADRFVDPPTDPGPPQGKLELRGPLGWTLLARDHGCPGPDQTLIDRSGPRDTEWFCIPAAQLDAAWRALEAAHARDLRLVSSPVAAVTAIELDDGHRRLALQEAQGRWRFVEPAVGYAADAEAPAEWLRELSRIRLTPAPAAGGAAARRLTLKNPQFSETIEAVGGHGSAVAVRHTGDPQGGTAPAGVLALLEPDPLRFRDRNVLDLARFDSRRLRVTSGTRARELVKGEGETWRPEPATAPAPAPAAIDRVLAALTNLRAQRFLDPSTPLPAPLTLELTEQPPGAPAPLQHIVELGPRRPDGCAARLKDRSGVTVFQVAPSTCDDLRALGP